MRVSLDWIKEFVDVTAAPQEVADRLTMAGLEVEGMEVADGDTLLEVNVTPNRPDCLSMLGIAREVAAVFGAVLKQPRTDIEKELPASGITVDILDPDLCPRYTGRLIKGISVRESPEWMKDRLEKCGIRSLNNIVDITNYVLLELGHPLHAFDAGKLAKGMIRVARAGEDSTITTLDGLERKLPEDALLIWDGKAPVAVAGIMGGEGSSVADDTIDVFLESAYFEPTSIRRTSRNLGLRSESSYRFERGTDIEFLENALNRAALLMKELGGGTIHEIVDAYPGRYVPQKVEVGYSRVNALLGTAITKEEMLSILSRIGIRTEDRGDSFYAYPPPYRRDILKYWDVVEEIARIHGFANIPVKNPRTVLSDGILNRKDISINKIKESVRYSGFTEVVNYSFMNPSDLDLLGIPDDDMRRRHIRVKNPLRQEESLMRTTLVPSLINNFLYNVSRGIRDIRLFELSRVFIDEGGRLPLETVRLGGILYREKMSSVWKEDTPAFFIMKGSLEALFEELKISGLSYGPSEEVFLHKGKSADIMAGKRKLGFIGEIGPGIVERLNLKVSRPEVMVFELSVDILLSLVSETVKYESIPKYPSIERDIAIILDDAVT
jgi:phenylalanyl-tRNA synthetase beta chain